MATKEQVMDAMKVVYDPEIGIDIVNLGLVYDVEVDEEQKSTTITMTLTTVGCPIFDMLAQQIRQIVGHLEGIEHVDVRLVFTPPWTPDFMSEEAKLLLRYMR